MKTIYFIAGVPNSAQKILATDCGTVIRNCNIENSGDFHESTDMVMGNVPANYTQYPRHNKDGEAQAILGLTPAVEPAPAPAPADDEGEEKNDEEDEKKEDEKTKKKMSKKPRLRKK